MNAAAGGAGFGNLLRAEWVKLRSVPRWTLGVGLAIALTVGLGVLGASESGTDANTNPDFVVSHDGKAVVDNFRFVHQPMTGDGSIVAHLVGQDPTHGSRRYRDQAECDIRRGLRRPHDLTR